MPSKDKEFLACDVAVIGGSLGGVAAALAAAEAGCRTVLVSAEAWIGGQITSQGVAPLDEHPLIEQFGATRRYARLRQRVRQFYQLHDGAPERMENGRFLNPGNGWVSHLCFEPKVGHLVLQAMLAPFIEAETLQIFIGFRPIEVKRQAQKIDHVTIENETSRQIELHAAYFLDATDLGDLLPLAQVPYVCGAEAQSDTGEPHACPDGPHPERVQAFTYTFLLEHIPGENHTIVRPRNYLRNREQQPFSLSLTQPDGSTKRFGMFAPTTDSERPFWTYRRVVDGQLLGRKRDVALINWHGNDYSGGSLIDVEANERQAQRQAAKELALGFLYYLQTEVPRDDGRGVGYPGLRLLKDGLGTTDGLSQVPYIRDSRRIVGYKRIVEQDVAAAANPTARAAHFADAVGVGWYSLDLHPAVGCADSFYLPTRPFQIPLGAFVSPDINNLLPACKNIATTHITNGAYRVHPVEWNIGETAGLLAAFCLQQAVTPQAVYNIHRHRRQFQRALLEAGIPLFWLTDISVDDPLFTISQTWLLQAASTAGGVLKDRLAFGLDDPLGVRDYYALFRLFGLEPAFSLPGDTAVSVSEANRTLSRLGFSANLHGAHVTPRQLLVQCGTAVGERMSSLPL